VGWLPEGKLADFRASLVLLTDDAQRAKTEKDEIKK
jgi:hypothetical protein